MAKVSPSGSSCYHPIRFHISLQVDSPSLKIFLKKLYPLYFSPRILQYDPSCMYPEFRNSCVDEKSALGEASEFAIFPLVPPY